MIASQGSGIGSLPKLQGHVVAQLHASMTSPRMRHEVSAGMTHLLFCIEGIVAAIEPACKRVRLCHARQAVNWR
jgi:hypothetical protein